MLRLFWPQDSKAAKELLLIYLFIFQIDHDEPLPDSAHTFLYH